MNKLDQIVNGNISIHSLRGQILPQNEEKVVETPSHKISLATNHQGMYFPDLQISPKEIVDNQAREKIINLDDEAINAIVSLSEFEELLTRMLAESSDYIFPQISDIFSQGFNSRYAFNNIRGRRIEQFFDELMVVCNKSSLSSDDKSSARFKISQEYREAFRREQVDFDQSDTESYWSFLDDCAFVNVYEKMLNSMGDQDPKRKHIQQQIDFILSNKYAHKEEIDEEDVENSLGLMAIDANSRHIVSIKKDSGNQPQYITLSLPPSTQNTEKKFVYRDEDNYYVEDSFDKLTSDQINKLEEQNVDKLVFRKTKPTDIKRKNFKFDWNNNNMLDSHDVGWWGHCDVKAVIETILADMNSCKKIVEYNSSSKKTTVFHRKDLLEALASILSLSDNYVGSITGQKLAFGKSNFGGCRFDDNASVMLFKLDENQSLRFPVKIKSISKNNSKKLYLKPKDAFSAKKIDDDYLHFRKNEEILRTENGDINFINGTQRIIAGETDNYTFDENGQIIEEKRSFIIDPNSQNKDKIFLGAEIFNKNEKTLLRYYFDPETKEISHTYTQFIKNKKKYTAHESTNTVVGIANDLEIGCEVGENDHAVQKWEMIQQALKTGDKIAVDSDVGAEVWNGEVSSVQMYTELVSDDGLWERVGFDMRATFAEENVKGTIIYHLDDEGKVIDSAEIDPGVDFCWKDRPRIAPFIYERGEWYINQSMIDRGLLKFDDSQDDSLQVIQDIYDLIYLGLKSNSAQETQKETYVIKHHGQRLLYDNKNIWRSDVNLLSNAANYHE